MTLSDHRKQDSLNPLGVINTARCDCLHKTDTNISEPTKENNTNWKPLHSHSYRQLMIKICITYYKNLSTIELQRRTMAQEHASRLQFSASKMVMLYVLIVVKLCISFLFLKYIFCVVL